MKIKSKLLMLLWTIILAFAMSSCSLGTNDSFSGSNLITVGGSSSLSREAASQLGRREVSSENINVEDIDLNTVVVSNLSTPLNISDQYYLEVAIKKGAMLLLENTTPSVMDKVVGIGIDSPSVAVMTSSDGLVLEVFAQGTQEEGQDETVSDTVSTETGVGDAVPSNLVEPESTTPSRTATSGDDFSPLNQLVKEAKKRENGNNNRAQTPSVTIETKNSPSWRTIRLILEPCTYYPGNGNETGLASISGIFEIDMASVFQRQKKVIILRSVNSSVTTYSLWKDEKGDKGFFTTRGILKMSPDRNKMPQGWTKIFEAPDTYNAENTYVYTTGWGFNADVSGGVSGDKPELKGSIGFSMENQTQARLDIPDFRAVNKGVGHRSEWQFEYSLWANHWTNLWNKPFRLSTVPLAALSKSKLPLKSEIIYEAPITDTDSHSFFLHVAHHTNRTWKGSPITKVYRRNNYKGIYTSITINLDKIRYPIKDRDLEDNMNAYIRNVYSQKYVDVRANSSSPGASLIQWDYHGGDNQRFIFKPSGDKASYHIIAENSKMVLSEGTKHFVKQRVLSSSDSQKWYIEPVLAVDDNIKYRFKNKASERYLYPISNSVQNSALLKTTRSKTERSVEWVIEG